MAHSNETPNLKLPVISVDDRPTWTGDFNEGMNKIDTGVTKVSDDTSQAISAMNTLIAALQTQLNDRYTKEQTNEIIAIAVQNFVTTGDLTSALEPYVTQDELNNILAPYAMTANVAPLNHTHTASQVTDFNSAVNAILAQRAPVITGPYASRPSAASQVAGTVHISTDVPEQAVVINNAWFAFGGGRIGYVQITSQQQFSGAQSTWYDVAGSQITFVAGARPVRFDLAFQLACKDTGPNLYRINVDGIALVSRKLNVGGGAFTLPMTAMANKTFTPGSSHVAKIEVAWGMLPPMLDASASDPNTFEITAL